MLKVKSSRVAWILFGIGIIVVFAGFVVRTSLTGVSPWMSPNKALADRVLKRFVLVALLLCIFAPWFSPVSLLRRLLFSALAAMAVGADYYICGFIHFLLYGV